MLRSMMNNVSGIAPHDALVGAGRAIESNEPLPERQSDTTYAAQVQPSWLPDFYITHSTEFLVSEPANLASKNKKARKQER
jgi:hypothetical protein